MESQSLYPDDSSAAPKQPAERASVVEDFLDIFYAPSQVFDRRRDGSFGLALLILVVLAGVLLFITKPVLQPAYDAVMDQQIAAAMRQNPGMNPEMANNMRTWGDKFFLVGALVNVPVMILLTGLALWLVSKVVDAKLSFGQSAMIATYANVPRFVLGSLVSGGQAYFMGPDRLTSIFSTTIGLARFAPEGSSWLVQNALNRVELFTIWATILLGIGVAVVGRVPRRQGFTAAAIVWVLGSLMVVLSAARQG